MTTLFTMVGIYDIVVGVSLNMKLLIGGNALRCQVAAVFHHFCIGF